MPWRAEWDWARVLGGMAHVLRDGRGVTRRGVQRVRDTTVAHSKGNRRGMLWSVVGGKVNRRRVLGGVGGGVLGKRNGRGDGLAAAGR